MVIIIITSGFCALVLFNVLASTAQPVKSQKAPA